MGKYSMGITHRTVFVIGNPFRMTLSMPLSLPPLLTFTQCVCVDVFWLSPALKCRPQLVEWRVCVSSFQSPSSKIDILSNYRPVGLFSLYFPENQTLLILGHSIPSGGANKYTHLGGVNLDSIVSATDRHSHTHTHTHSGSNHCVPRVQC